MHSASATSRSFRVLHGEDLVPDQLRNDLVAAAIQLETCFPATLPQVCVCVCVCVFSGL